MRRHHKQRNNMHSLLLDLIGETSSACLGSLNFTDDKISDGTKVVTLFGRRK